MGHTYSDDCSKNARQSQRVYHVTWVVLPCTDGIAVSPESLGSAMVPITSSFGFVIKDSTL